MSKKISLFHTILIFPILIHKISICQYCYIDICNIDIPTKIQQFMELKKSAIVSVIINFISLNMIEQHKQELLAIIWT